PLLRDRTRAALCVSLHPYRAGAGSFRLVREPMSIGGQSETSLEVGRRHDVANRSATGRNGQNLLTLDTVLEYLACGRPHPGIDAEAAACDRSRHALAAVRGQR